MFRYAHTNLIARDLRRLIEFYKTVFRCESIGETRDLQGEWLDRLTGIPGAHILGEHLLLPGYGDNHPTLEIFSYDQTLSSVPAVNRRGLGHLAFEVDDVQAVLRQVLDHGGSQVGELVRTRYPDGRQAVFVYAADPEGNILEIQSWE